MNDRAFALRFISGRYQGAEYPLAAAGEVVIGRQSSLDMVLAEEMVSRKHAKLTLAPGGSITITDLGSTNGTFVNGEKVRSAALEEGDRVLIGTSILKVVIVARTLAPHDPRAAQQDLDRAAAAHERRGGSRSSVQGHLEEVPLVDLLQLLSTSKKTGAIVLSGGSDGRVHLRAGKIVFASIDSAPGLAPKKALYRMLAWGNGTFEFVGQEGELPPIRGEIVEGTQELLLEAMQRLDELDRSGLAAASALALAAPLTPPLRELTPAEIDLVQLVHNHGTVQAVLDRADGNDVEVAQTLVSLVERGYLVRP
jgi:hypothetical protein